MQLEREIFLARGGCFCQDNFESIYNSLYNFGSKLRKDDFLLFLNINCAFCIIY